MSLYADTIQFSSFLRMAQGPISGRTDTYAVAKAAALPVLPGAGAGQGYARKLKTAGLKEEMRVELPELRPPRRAASALGSPWHRAKHAAAIAHLD